MSCRLGWIWASSPSGVERWYKARIGSDCEAKLIAGHETSQLVVVTVQAYWRIVPAALVFSQSDDDPKGNKPEPPDGDVLQV